MTNGIKTTVWLLHSTCIHWTWRDKWRLQTKETESALYNCQFALSEELILAITPADHVAGYAHLPPHRWTTLYHGSERSSVNGRSHMRVLPPGTLCPTTSAPCLILASSENCWNHSILVILLTFVDFFCVLAFGWLLQFTHSRGPHSNGRTINH